jgi:hypothetical protein
MGQSAEGSRMSGTIPRELTKLLTFAYESNYRGKAYRRHLKDLIAL